MYLTWLLTILFLLQSTEVINGNGDKCGYSSCNNGKPGVINVHLIPHSHDDVGWLKTVDQYYYGSRDSIQSAGVQYILDTVVRSLYENPNRKFSYVEMAYFTRWWNNQNKEMKLMVHQLVNEGRLQFLLGGWVMNDEADAHYSAIIDQMTLGLDFLNQTFGECGRPLVAWQIDPFGHSIEQSNLFAMMGFDANIFWRIDYRDKNQRIEQKRMEFIQNTSFFKSAKTNSLFTSILYDTYCTPASFCFDDKCQDPPMMDDPSLNDYNIIERVNNFAKYVISQSKIYTSNNILIPMGCDFQFQNAYHNFINLDKLIFHVNRLRKDINVMYSTPACYIYSVNKAKQHYSYKTDDFFPYASGPNSYWTGYFTSRSALKGFIRETNNVYQTCKQAQVISMLNNTKFNKKVKFMGMKIGVAQHHDAVSGTEKQEVAYDYAQRLYNGWSACEEVLSSSISKLFEKSKNEQNFSLCSLTNISYCLPSDNMPYKNLTFVLYNSLTYSHTHWCRIPVTLISGDVYYVMDSNEYFIPSQLINITERTKSIPERPKNSSANFELIFNTKLPPMGYTTYVIRREHTNKFNKVYAAELSTTKKIKGKNFSIKNKNLILSYKENLLAYAFNIKSLVGVNLSQSIRYYYSMKGDGQNSGAYIFRPTTTKPLTFNQSVDVLLINGTLVTEIHQKFSNWATLVTRLYKDDDKFESEWTVGPIPITNPTMGREIVLHYETDLKTENSFFTDSNGRQLITRKINQRFDYKFNQTEPVSGNYYPITTDVCLVDLTRSPNVGLIIHTDRPLGGGAYQSGMIEIMLHRRTLADDNFGVNEPLNELGSDGKGLIVRGKQWLKIDYIDNIVVNRRIENVRLFSKPLTLFSQNSFKTNDSNTNLNKRFSALKLDIPHNVHILSMENHFTLNNEVDYEIVRIENLYSYGNNASIIDLGKIFSSLTILKIEEVNLSANQYLKDSKTLHWNNQYNKMETRLGGQGTIISLLPTEIRTFKVIFKKL